MSKNVKLIVLIVLMAILAVFCGCSMVQTAEEPEITDTPMPIVTSTPEVVDIRAVPTEEPLPAPTVTPTPEPENTPVPFSVLAPTVNMSYEELVGSTNDMKEKTSSLVGKGFPSADKYYIIVDKYWQVVMVYLRKPNSNQPDLDHPVRYMLCSTGNPDKEYGHETQNGIWKIDLPRERFWQFVNLEAAQYLTCIHSRTYFHSVLYKTRADLSSLIKDSYDNLGKKASHACVRLTVPDSRWIFYNIAPGTTCEVRDGKASDELTGGIKAQLRLPESKTDVKLNPRDYPWTDNWSIEDVEHVVGYKYMQPRTPEGYDENGNKIDNGGGNNTEPVPTDVDPVPVNDNGESGGGGGGSEFEPVYIDG